MLLWEICDRNLCYYHSNSNLTRRINGVMLIILIYAGGNRNLKILLRFKRIIFLVEHIFFNINQYVYIKIRAEETADIERDFYLMDYSFVFRYIPYSRTISILLKVL